MKCAKCNHKFVKSENWVNRINGTKITVCPECGNEELFQFESNKTIDKLKNYKSKELDDLTLV